MAADEYMIRPAKREDAADLLALIKELALYEKEADAVEATEELILRYCFDEGHVAHAAVVQHTETSRVVGFVIYFYNYSTWTGKPGIYLEDLFVQEQHRRAGLGKRLFAYLGKVCKEQGCARLDWAVLKWNQPSIDFYKQAIGAREMSEWQGMRLDGTALDRLEHLA